MHVPNICLARHIIIDYYMCKQEGVLQQENLEKILNTAAKISGATIISSHFHTFSPIWVSGVVVLSESHFTLHSWPEHNYVAIDMFACGDIDFEKAIAYIQEELWSQQINIVSDLPRGTIWNLSQSIEKLPVSQAQKNMNWEWQFRETNPWGIQCGVDIYNCNPESIRDAELIKRYVTELCELIEMKTFWETQVVHFWEDERVAGYSMTQLIETSLISGHFANDSNTAYIDVFSCKYYNPNTVADFTLKFFEGKDYKLSINLRM